MSKKSHDITSSSSSLTLRKHIVLIILLAALGLRLWGVGYGLPYIFHPDENRQILDSLGMAERLSLLPEEYSYPALHKYLLVVVNGAYFVTGWLLGRFSTPSDFALKFLEGTSSVFLLSRLLSVAGGTFLCLVVYRTGVRFFSEKTGLVALVFSAGMFHLIQHSQWAIADIFLSLFTAASLYFIILSTKEKSGKNTTLAFVLVGLAISTKPQGLFLLVPLFVGQFFVLKDSWFDFKWAGFLRTRAAGLTLLVFASLLGNLSWLFNFTETYGKFRMLSQVAHLGISSEAPFTPGVLSLIKWFSYEMARQEGPLGVVLVAGIVYAAVRHTREDLIFLSYLVVFVFAVKDWAIRYLHLFVALFPALCLLGARMTSDFITRARLNRLLAGALTVAIILPSAAWSIDASVTKGGIDTREEAKKWVEANIPAGATVAVDWYEFSIPFWSEVPVYLQNPKARDHFEKNVSASVRKGYSEFLKNRPVFRVLPIIYSTEGPNWPADMPPEATKKASSMEVYRELYSVFNFHTVEELKKEGVRYIILTSYAYTNFLLDSDPYKNEKGVFNYLIREDLLSFNKQADAYDKQSPFGLLYFLNKRARDFYCPLLRAEKGRLVMEFSPEGGRPGPFIKIYEI